MHFAKHETFHLREGWLFKGMHAIVRAEAEGELPTIFLDKDAPERLGMGRNMTRSLRFWMQASGLAHEEYEGRLVQRLTELGQLVWNHDRFLENDATLWLIHYALASSDEHATSWYWFFNHFAPTSFSDEEAIEALQNWVTIAQSEKTVAKSSLKKDISCLLRTYLPDKRSRSPENLRESPLARLNILDQVEVDGRKRYYWHRADASRLEPLIVLYVLLDRQIKFGRESRQVRLSQVLQEPKNVGRIFNLTMTSLTDLLDRLGKQHPDYRVQVVRTAGLDQLTLPDIPLLSTLERYYTEEHALLEVT